MMGVFSRPRQVTTATGWVSRLAETVTDVPATFSSLATVAVRMRAAPEVHIVARPAQIPPLDVRMIVHQVPHSEREAGSACRGHGKSLSRLHAAVVRAGRGGIKRAVAHAAHGGIDP